MQKLTIPLSQRLPAVISAGAYVGYLKNGRGEELVFIREAGESHATLWHSRGGWRSYRLTARSEAERLVAIEVGLPTASTLHLFRQEHVWLMACWESAHGIVAE
jgi:hypothetical protein